MAYGKIYTTNWWADKYANEFQLFISKKDYTGSTTNFQLIDGYSLNHAYRGGRDAEYLPIHGSELNFSIWTQPQIQLFNDTNFDQGFDIWKTQAVGSLPWFYVDGEIFTEVDGGDYSDFLYQSFNITSGRQYKVVVDYEIEDANENHEAGINFANANPLSGNQFYPFNVDAEYYNGETTITFTANANYTKAGLVLNAGGASLTVRSLKIYELGTDYSALMEADYNEYKTTLLHKAQLVKNPTFVERSSNSVFDNWANNYDGAGITSWEYNTTYNCLSVVSDGGSWSDILHQDISLHKGQTYKVKIHFTVDNNWNTSQLRLTTFEDPLYDPPTHVILMSGNSSPSYSNPNVALIDAESSDSIPYGVQYWIEYTITPNHYYSAIGFSWKSNDEGIYIHSFEIETDETVFVGWVKPDNISKRFLKEQYYMNINSIDGLADLKNFEYFVQPAYAPMIEILEDVLTYTGLGLPFTIQNNITHDTVDAYNWYDCEVDKRRFITDRKGKKTYANAYSVVEDILKPFNCQLRQFNGRWLIQNFSENNTRRIIYQTGSTYFSGIIDRTVDITKFVPDSDEVSKIQPVKGVNLTLDSMQYDDQFIDNGRFDLNLDGWDEHGETFTTFQRISADGDAYLRTRRIFANDFTTMSFSGLTYLPNPSITIGNNRDKFTISMDIMVVSPSTTSQKPELRIAAWRNYTADTGQEFQIPLNVSGEFPTNTWVNVEREFSTWADMGNDFPTPVKVDIGIWTPTAANNQTIEIYFDNIKLEYDFAVEGNDKTTYSIELDIYNPLLQTIVDEIKFGDGHYSGDISVIKLPNGKKSSLWHNYDFSITGATIIKLIAKERLRQNLSYRDYLRCSVIDEDFTITPNSILQIFDKKYKIVGYNRKFLMGHVDLELTEFKFGTIGDVQDFYYPSYTTFDY